MGFTCSPSWSDCTAAPSAVFYPIISKLVFSSQTTKSSLFSYSTYYTAPTPLTGRSQSNASFEKRSREGPWPPLSHARNKAKHLVRPDHVAVFSSVVTPDSSCHLWHHYRSDLALFRWQSALMHSGKELGQMGRRIWKVADAFLRNPEGKKKETGPHALLMCRFDLEPCKDWSNAGIIDFFPVIISAFVGLKTRVWFSLLLS